MVVLLEVSQQTISDEQQVEWERVRTLLHIRSYMFLHHLYFICANFKKSDCVDNNCEGILLHKNYQGILLPTLDLMIEIVVFRHVCFNLTFKKFLVAQTT